jgi:pimeloyl-ACP methyl ester carboxylesterase
MAELKEIVRFSRIATNGINLHVAEAGPSEGPLVVLLHGFPEFWYSWRNQIAPLAEDGFHVLAPDQRGYNLSDKPQGIGSYDLDHLAADVIGLADHFRHEAFSLVGHDWGASVGWWLAGRHPSCMRRLVVLNAPHPAVWLDAMRNHPVQKRKSGYVRLLELPYLPEFLIGINRSKALAKGFRASIRPDAFTEGDLSEYRKAWAQPRALSATINYYRAVLRKALLPASQYQITCPTLVIWGKRDVYAIPELAEASSRLCVNCRIEYLDRSTHWVQHDEPGRVNELLAEFLRRD